MENGIKVICFEKTKSTQKTLCIKFTPVTQVKEKEHNSHHVQLLMGARPGAHTITVSL
jgi:hypothetical protein